MPLDPQLEQEKRDGELRELLGTKAGQAVVWRLLVTARVFGSTFDLDSRAHAFQEGRRDLGLWLMAEAQRVAPDKYVEMVRERTNFDLRELAQRRSENESSHR